MENVSDVPISMSFSKLNTYENCPRRFYYTYIAVGELPTIETEQMRFGTRVHSSLENYAKSSNTAALSVESLKYKGAVDRIRDGSGQKYYEHQMAVKQDRCACGWDDEGLYLRGIADVLVVDGSHAVCLDYKTGKPKTDTTQLMIFALLTMCHYPEVEEVTSSFLWLKNDSVTSTIFKRRWADSYWDNLEKRIVRVHDSVRNNDYPTRPTKLCGWCQAKHICADAYEERSRR